MPTMTASLVEIGWFHPASVVPSPLDVAGFSHRPLEGLVESAQFFRVRLEASAEHLVVSAHHPPDSAQRVEEIRAAVRAIDSTALSLTLDDRTGWARVDAEGRPADAAAAVAIVKAAAGWDESSPIVVQIGACAFDVVLEHDLERDTWHVQVDQQNP